MKISTIRNALIKQTIVVVVILGVFSGIVLYVDSFNEECDRNINQLVSQTDGIVRQVADLSLEYNKVMGYTATYNEIKQKQDNKMLTVNKLALRDAIVKARSQYHVDNLDVKMEEIKPLVADKYKRTTAFIESSNTTINLSGLSDLDILGIVKVLQKSFLGIRFTSLKFSLAKDLDNTALIAVKDTGFSPIVNSKLTFTLFGLRNVNSTDNDLLNEVDKVAPQNSGRGNNNNKRIRLRRP